MGAAALPEGAAEDGGDRLPESLVTSDRYSQEELVAEFAATFMTVVAR